MKQIVLFNNKGGVGKTTFLMHLGYALEKSGKRILFVDADPQCNLTTYICDETQIENFWNSNNSIYSIVKPLISATGDIAEMHPYQKPGRNIWLLPGDLALSEFEESLSSAWVNVLAGREAGFRITSAFYRAIKTWSDANKIDFVLIDVGPNLGSLNRTILLGCDFFIVPLVPDLFSLRGLENIGRTFVTWIKDWQSAINRFSGVKSFIVQEGKPTFAGYLCQQFNIYRRRETVSWQIWTEKVPDAVNKNIIQKLREIDHTLVRDLNNGSFKIGDMRNYHSLAPKSQTYQKPIFELTSSDGIVGNHASIVQECKDEFDKLADIIIRNLSN